MGAEKRKAVRHRACLRADIRAKSLFLGGYILDISDGGMRVSTDTIAEIWAGERVEVRCRELGLLTGTVRWRSPGEFGVRFDESTNTAAKVQHFRKVFVDASGRGAAGPAQRPQAAYQAIVSPR